MFCPLDRTGKVETFSGGDKLPRMRGPRMGGNGAQSPTTSPAMNTSFNEVESSKTESDTCFETECTLVQRANNCGALTQSMIEKLEQNVQQ